MPTRLDAGIKESKMDGIDAGNSERASLRKAYENIEFLKSADARSVRVLCEFTEPDSRFRRHNIRNTIVFFGSTHVLPRAAAEESLNNNVSSQEPTQACDRARRNLIMSRYYEDAVKLAEKLTRWSQQIKDPRKRFLICTGGGPGIMEAGNRGARNAGGQSIGLNITLPTEQIPNPYQTTEISFLFHYFFIRKFWFFYLAKALIVFPGGFGTMDELFELLTLIQTRKTTKYMPVVIYGSEYWNEVLNFDALMKWGTISPEDVNLFRFFDDVDTTFDYLTDELTRHYLKNQPPPD